MWWHLAAFTVFALSEIIGGGVLTCVGCVTNLWFEAIKGGVTLRVNLISLHYALALNIESIGFILQQKITLNLFVHRTIA